MLPALHPGLIPLLLEAAVLPAPATPLLQGLPPEAIPCLAVPPRDPHPGRILLHPEAEVLPVPESAAPPVPGRHALRPAQAPGQVPEAVPADLEKNKLFLLLLA